MKAKLTHRWELSPKEAIELQLQLARRIVLKDAIKPKQIRYIAGADVSYSRRSRRCYAAVVVFEFPSLKIVEQAQIAARESFPYIPGLLSFREAPALIKVFKKIKSPIDLLVFDGQGIAHPRRLGLASHIGLVFDKPSIGCAKTLLFGTYKEPGKRKGSWYNLYDKKGEAIGFVLRSRTGCRPIFISPGHKISLNTSLEIVKKCLGKYRLPEVTRQPHILSNSLRTKLEK